MDMFIYFSHILNKEVLDKNHELVGRLYEVVTIPTEVYPKSWAMVISQGFFKKKYALIPWGHVLEMDEKGVHLKCEKSSLNFAPSLNYQDKLALRRDVLDQQVIDTYNYNVIRVNDIHLLKVDHDLMIAHVDISLRGLVRRMGWNKVVDSLVKLVSRKSLYLQEKGLVSWKYVQPLSINPVSKTIKVNIPQKDFSRIPAADFGEIMIDLDPKQRIHLFKTLDIKTQSRIFAHLDFKTQKAIMEEIGPKVGAEILMHMADDEATDFLERMPRHSVDLLLERLETKEVKKLSRLLGYASDSAGGLMTLDYMAIPKDTTVEAALNIIRGKSFSVEPIQYVYIVDENNKLVGLTNLRRFLSSPPEALITSTAFNHTAYVHLDDGVQEVAYLMEKYKYQALAVVNGEGILQGIITIDDILSQVIAIAWRKTRKKVPRTL